MKAEITVTRTPYNVPQEVTVSVELDRDGDVFAVAVDSIYKKQNIFWRETESYETVHIREWLCEEGKPFELEPDEIEEAKKAIASNQRAYDRLVAQFPLAGLSPHEEGK